MAMRSGPSTRTTACVTRRQVKWCGGPSGTVANGTLIGSGLSNSRSGRSGGSLSVRAGQAGRADAVDQRRQFVIVMNIGIEIALLLHHDFGTAGGQPNEIEAEAGIERIIQ